VAGWTLPRPQAAWDAAISTGALRLVDYDIASALSQIYSAQAHLMRMTGHLYVVYQPATFEIGKQRKTVQMVHWTLVEVENSVRALLNLYQTHLPNSGLRQNSWSNLRPRGPDPPMKRIDEWHRLHRTDPPVSACSSSIRKIKTCCIV
jgi:hypothetical protein